MRHGSRDHPDQKDRVSPRPVCTELFTKYTALQFGEAPDPFGWTEVVDL